VILADTGALYALIDRNDVNHEGAREYYTRNMASETFYVSLPVLTETWLLIDARLGDHFANRLWDSATKGIFGMLDITPDDLRSGLEIEKKYRDVSFGFVDSICFALCEKYRIRKVFTYDRKHFGIYKPKFADSLDLLP
jgi:predicted nucleic acid-binding protein